MTQDVLDSLFSLPPPEQRKVPSWMKRLFAQELAGHRRYDELFIMYLVMRTSLWIAIGFFLLNVLSHAAHLRLNFYIVTIDLTGDGFVKTFLLTYARYTSTVLLFLVLPYYFIVWHRNFENMSCSANITRGGQQFKPGAHPYVAAIFFVTVIFVCMYGSFGIFALHMDTRHYENSYPYFLFCGTVWPVVLAVLNAGSLLFTLTFFFDFTKKDPTGPLKTALPRK